MQKAKLEGIMGQGKGEKPLVKQLPTETETAEAHRDPLKELLKSPWEIECDKCGKHFMHTFTDEELNSLEDSGAFIECPTCKDYPPFDVFGSFPTNHKVFIRMADVFRAYLQGSRIIEVKT